MSVKAFPLKSCSQEQMVENRGVGCGILVTYRLLLLAENPKKHPGKNWCILHAVFSLSPPKVGVCQSEIFNLTYKEQCLRR